MCRHNAGLTCLTQSKARAIRAEDRPKVWKPTEDGSERGREGLRIVRGFEEATLVEHRDPVTCQLFEG